MMKRKMHQPMTGYSITYVRSKDKKGNEFIHTFSITTRSIPLGMKGSMMFTIDRTLKKSTRLLDMTKVDIMEEVGW